MNGTGILAGSSPQKPSGHAPGWLFAFRLAFSQPEDPVRGCVRNHVGRYHQSHDLCRRKQCRGDWRRWAARGAGSEARVQPAATQATPDGQEVGWTALAPRKIRSRQRGPLRGTAPVRYLLSRRGVRGPKPFGEGPRRLFRYPQRFELPVRLRRTNSGLPER